MTASTDKKEFLTKQVPELLKKLEADVEPAFGLMTPQHMVEHLTYVVKSTNKRYGEPVDPLTKGQLGFRKFIENGAILKHRPSDKTKMDLPELKYSSLEDAVSHIPDAVNRFYNHFEKNTGFKAYSRFIGEMGFEELELFHYQHYRYHLWQFGLLESYP